jgi:hypothetical protein
LATPRPLRRAAASTLRSAEAEHTVNEREPSNDDDTDPEGVDLPDRPEGSFEDAATAAGQLEGESIDERIRREQPDRPRRDRDPDAAGRIVDQDEPDDEAELVGDAAEQEIDLSTEEAAVHVRPNAPGGTDDASDGYLEGEDR